MTQSPMNDLEIRRALADVLDLAPPAEAALNRAHGIAPSRDRHLLVPVAAGVIVIAGVASVLTVQSRDGEPAAGTAAVASSQPAASSPTGITPSEPAPAELEYSLNGLGWPPHILIGDGWEVVSVDQRSINEGLISFERDGQIAYVGWNRADQSVPDKGLEDATELGAATLLGEPVTMLQSSVLMYSESDIRELVASGDLPAEGALADFAPGATAVPPASGAPDGATTTTTTAAGGPAPAALVGGPLLDEALADAVAAGQIRPVQNQGPLAFVQWDGTGLSVTVSPIDSDGDFYDAGQFAALLATVGYTDEATWLAALPDRVVTPATRQQVVGEMLAGVPLPDGFSPDSFAANNNLVQDRITVAGELQHRVACSWLNTYFQAGDPAARSATAAALETMPDWPASQELQSDNVPRGVIPSGDGVGSLTIRDDDTIVNDATGEELDGYSVAQLCDFNAVG